MVERLNTLLPKVEALPDMTTLNLPKLKKTTAAPKLKLPKLKKVEI